MNEAKEPEIKLFGRKIVLPENCENSASKYPGESSGGGVCDRYSRESREERNEEKADGVKMLRAEEDQVSETWETNSQEINQSSVASAEECQNPKTKSESDANPVTPTGIEDPISEGHSKSENDATNGQQRMLKKPDKILHCPRCSSMDTKFCYYNNYNVSQPRHFCKSCQRYWTAGGTMRNVPVGAGRRKTKNSASYCRHVAISEALSASRTDGSNGLNLPAVKPSGVVLSFGTDSPMCESTASALNPADKRVQHGVRTNEEFNGIDSSSKNVPQAPVFQNLNGFPSPIPFIPGVPWPFPWNSYLPLPALYPMPFYPAAPYWNCALPNTWPFPWVPVTSPSANQNSPSSPLSKHSRNEELINPNKTECKEDKEPRKLENSIVVPKTLRIHDPEEASKSSIWETLGIKCDSISGKGLFEALQPKCSEKKNKIPVTTSRALLANPAALSRSITFQESA